MDTSTRTNTSHIKTERLSNKNQTLRQNTSHRQIAKHAVINPLFGMRLHPHRGLQQIQKAAHTLIRPNHLLNLDNLRKFIAKK